MKITMLNDAAYVGYELSEVLRQQGIDIRLLTRNRGLVSKTLGVTWNALRAEGIIHVHGAMQEAWMIQLLRKHLDVLHCHGSEIRWGLDGKWDRLIKSSIKNATRVIYATPDIESRIKDLRQDALYLPTPINTDRFSYYGAQQFSKERPLRALYFFHQAHTSLLDYESIPSEILQKFQDNRIILDIINKGSISYQSMPELFRQYDIYIDRFVTPSFSKTCLEAQSMGLATIDYRHKGMLSTRVNELMDFEMRQNSGKNDAAFIRINHDRRKVALELLDIYRKL